MTRIYEPTTNKYHAVKTWSELCQRTFDSKAEAKRGEELALLERAGEIGRLVYQKRLVLSDKPKITITLDFQYLEMRPGGAIVYEDVKGYMTRDFRTKLAWLHEKYGIVVTIIK